MKSKFIAIIGIDTFLPKNFNQIECINKKGYFVEILTNNLLNSSFEHVQKINSDTDIKNKIILLNKGFFSRLYQIFKYFLFNFKNLKHIEIYSGGRFSFIYVLLGRLFRIKTICMERGDLSNLDKYDKLTLFSMNIVYKYSFFFV